MICSRCNEEGHQAVACSKPFFKTCDHCKAVGHTSNKCPSLISTCDKKVKADKARAARMAKRSEETKSETSEISTAASFHQGGRQVELRAR